MALKFPSEEWIKQLQVEVNRSQDYAEAAATWEGDFYFIVEPGHGVEQEIVFYVDLWHGKCREACVVADRSARQPEFRISAPLPGWQQVITRQVDPIQALITRKLKLQGNMLKIMKTVKAAHELVLCTTRVPTQYPDGPSST